MEGRGRVAWRAGVLAKHLMGEDLKFSGSLSALPCVEYEPPESNAGTPPFDLSIMRHLMDGHNIDMRESVFKLMASSELFQLQNVAGKVYLGADYNQSCHEQREKTLQRIVFMRDHGMLKGFLTDLAPENFLRVASIFECVALFDHSMSVKLGVHVHLWGGAIQFLGTKRHHDKWLQLTEDYVVRGCFSMTELGHGSNVRGIETITTYHPETQEFEINTPCESAQKYWIGGAADHATHTIVFSQLYMGGKNEGVHAFVAQIRDEHGQPMPGVRIADCGLKIGLNGVDNGRLWFDKIRVPRENLLNSVADVTPEGKYESAIADPDQRFGAFMAPLTTGRVVIATSAVYTAKMGLATAIRYALSRRAFSLSNNEQEVLLLDYPSHQHRMLPLVAKTYAMSFAANDLKKLYSRRTPADAKNIHVLSSGLKALLTWHNLRTLQECREACGGQGLKTDNRIGQAKAEFDVQLTFEGDNNVLMQQVSKALLGDYVAAQKRGKPMKGLGLEHMNGPMPIVPADLNRSTLRSSKFQVSLFQLRERVLLQRLAEEVASRVSAGSSGVEAINQSYQLSERLGEAFSERNVLQSILNSEAEQSGGIKEMLSLLRSLYVVTVLDENPVFLRYGLLSPTQAQILQYEVAALCIEVRPHALALVTSFGIPQTLLGPIAYNWVEYNAWKYVKST